jgi:hypothetical protein
MPLKDKSLYPPDWNQIALREKQRAHWMCEECGADCWHPTSQVTRMSVHHKDHDPNNNHSDNLIALCSGCHLRADALHHARNAAITRATKIRGPMLPLLLMLMMLVGCTVEVDGNGLRAYSPQANADATRQALEAHNSAAATSVAIQAIATREAAVTIAKVDQAQAEVADLFWWGRLVLFVVGLPLVAFLALAIGRAAWGMSGAVVISATIRAQAVYPNERANWPAIITGSAVHNLDTSEVYTLDAPKSPDPQQVAVGGAVRVTSLSGRPEQLLTLRPIERTPLTISTEM